ncbi:MAG: hypothetical protein WAM14_05245 [Candidatus Nitrosopolaris sp.]
MKYACYALSPAFFASSYDMLVGIPIKIWIVVIDHIFGRINNAKPMLINGSVR